MCLSDNDFTHSTCCYPIEGGTICSNRDQNTICTNKFDFKTDAVREFACAAKNEKCPMSMSEISVDIKEKDVYYHREHKWNEIVPTQKAEDWRCKYQV